MLLATDALVVPEKEGTAMTRTAARPDTISDYFRLDDELTADEISVRDKVRAFAEHRVLPVINEYWEKAEFPYELLPGLAELGIVGTTIRGYGCPGMSRKAAGVVAREMARADGSMGTFFGVHSNLAMQTIEMLGSQEQKERWLPRMADLDAIGAFALTEPDHGSDAVLLETRARRDGDHYVLNGAKRWIGNGHAAEVVVLFARNVEDGKVNAFVVEKDADGHHPAGYHPTVITGKVGKRAILQADIVIQDMRIPAENRLADCRSFELTAMQLMCNRMVELADKDELTNAKASMVKMATSQKGKWICNEARELLAGNGLLLENHVARHLTDMEVVSTYEGTDSIQALLVGRDITGISAFR